MRHTLPAIALFILCSSVQALEISADSISVSKNKQVSTYSGNVHIQLNQGELHSMESDVQEVRADGTHLSGQVQLTLNNGDTLTADTLSIVEDATGLSASGQQVVLTQTH